MGQTETWRMSINPDESDGEESEGRKERSERGQGQARCPAGSSPASDEAERKKESEIHSSARDIFSWWVTSWRVRGYLLHDRGRGAAVRRKWRRGRKWRRSGDWRRGGPGGRGIGGWGR
jgi:hypothetical protein